MGAGPQQLAERRRPLKLGVQLPEIEYAVRWDDVRAIAQRAEAVGFDSLWTGDHLLYRPRGGPARGPWEAWSMLAAVAAVTERIELGPLVASTSFHNPAMLAKKAATVDEISGGRLILGLGAGWNRVEYEAYGFPYDHRVSRFEEAFTIIRALLRDGYVDFQGRFYSARDCALVPRGPRPGGPPLLIGSNGERMLRIAAPHVDAWNTWFTDTGNSPEGVAALREAVDAACRDVGRDPSTLERTVAVLVQLPGGRGRFGGDYGRRTVEPVVGEPEQIAEALRAYADEGVGHLQLVVDPITEASIEALGPVLEALDRS